MAHAGDELLNPVSGQRLVFLQTTEDTKGELLEVESTYEAGGQQPPVHYPLALTSGVHGRVG